MRAKAAAASMDPVAAGEGGAIPPDQDHGLGEYERPTSGMRRKERIGETLLRPPIKATLLKSALT
ncbi:hypothetical protein CKO38_03715 [Rhodospirillum rubrum]|nr:hypothetical protein [Rhodospirillum rubrum]MBK1675793.1 hypothetical protein [Rhodospirillum rubrum]